MSNPISAQRNLTSSMLSSMETSLLFSKCQRSGPQLTQIPPLHTHTHRTIQRGGKVQS
jgi:hypothetical protein